MQWTPFPTKLQKDLFDDARSVGELLQASVVKGKSALPTQPQGGRRKRPRHHAHPTRPEFGYDVAGPIVSTA